MHSGKILFTEKNTRIVPRTDFFSLRGGGNTITYLMNQRMAVDCRDPKAALRGAILFMAFFA